MGKHANLREIRAGSEPLTKDDRVLLLKLVADRARVDRKIEACKEVIWGAAAELQELKQGRLSDQDII